MQVPLHILYDKFIISFIGPQEYRSYLSLFLDNLDVVG